MEEQKKAFIGNKLNNYVSLGVIYIPICLFYQIE